MALRVNHGPSITIPTALVGAATVSPTLLSVSNHSQTQDNWCWAACAKMIFDYFSTNGETQCQMAEHAFYPASCCISPSSAACDRPYYPASVFNRVSFAFRFESNAIGSTEIHQQLIEERPIELLWRWHAGNHFSGHLLLIVGDYPTATSDPRDLEIIDPRPTATQGRFAYDEVIDAEGLGAWVESYVDLDK